MNNLIRLRIVRRQQCGSFARTCTAQVDDFNGVREERAVVPSVREAASVPPLGPDRRARTISSSHCQRSAPERLGCNPSAHCNRRVRRPLCRNPSVEAFYMVYRRDAAGIQDVIEQVPEGVEIRSNA